MKKIQWTWWVGMVCVLALAWAITGTWPSARAVADPLPAKSGDLSGGPGDGAGMQEDLGDPALDDPLAWIDDGPGEGPLEAPHDGRGERGMGMGPGGRGMGRGPEFGHSMRGGMGLQGLDLSSEQRRRIDDIRDRQLRGAIRARADLRIARLDLRKLMRASNPDRRAIEAQIDHLGSLGAAMQKARVGTMFEVRSVLTSAQRDKLQEMRERGPRMGGRMGTN